jgi:DnaK suppressor protein
LLLVLELAMTDIACHNQLAELLHHLPLLRDHNMTNSELTLHREKLLALRASLLGDVIQMEGDTLNDHRKTMSIPTDREELGSDTTDQELTVTLLGSDKDVLDQIETALQRIEDRGYGRCEDCGEPIPKSRLDAIPYAADCERCASQQEKGHEAVAQ